MASEPPDLGVQDNRRCGDVRLLGSFEHRRSRRRWIMAGMLMSRPGVDVALPLGVSKRVVRVMVVVVMAVLVLSVWWATDAIRHPAPRCIGDLYPPTSPCYEPPA